LRASSVELIEATARKKSDSVKPSNGSSRLMSPALVESFAVCLFERLEGRGRPFDCVFDFSESSTHDRCL
jgi:hypothetical protein